MTITITKEKVKEIAQWTGVGLIMGFFFFPVPYLILIDWIWRHLTGHPSGLRSD